MNKAVADRAKGGKSEMQLQVLNGVHLSIPVVWIYWVKSRCLNICTDTFVTIYSGISCSLLVLIQGRMHLKVFLGMIEYIAYSTHCGCVIIF